MIALMAIAPVIIGLLAVSALFSAAETAMTGASRGRMHQLEREINHVDELWRDTARRSFESTHLAPIRADAKTAAVSRRAMGLVQERSWQPVPSCAR